MILKAARFILCKLIKIVGGYSTNWDKNSSKLFLEFGDKVEVFDLNGKLISVLNNNSPIIKQQRYFEPNPLEDWGKYQLSYPILRAYAPDLITFSPDGKRALLDIENVSTPYDRIQRDIYLIDLKNGKTKLLIKNGSFPSWIK